MRRKCKNIEEQWNQTENFVGTIYCLRKCGEKKTIYATDIKTMLHNSYNVATTVPFEEQSPQEILMNCKWNEKNYKNILNKWNINKINLNENNE